MKKKRSITLIEIMIVILLIGIIGGALAFNMRGSMDQGRAFKSEQNMLRLHDILMLEYAKGELELSAIVADWGKYVAASPMVKDGGRELIRDGWKKVFKLSLSDDQEDILISSEKLEAFKTRHEKS
ncbi:MAG: prepilin-type N-terminal cleavage/methylation domain-containing protein [Chlamydiales bacterium]